LWIGGSNGLFKYDRKNKRFIRHKFSGGYNFYLNIALVHSLSEDEQGTLWTATRGMGIFKINKNRTRCTNYRNNPQNPNSLNFNVISSVCTDRSGVVWVSTFGSGINKMIPKRKQFRHYINTPDNPQSLGKIWVVSMIEDNGGNFWIGTVSDGLKKFENGTFTPYSLDSVRELWYPYYSISSICHSQSGKLWLARGTALSEFDPQTGECNNYYGKYLVYAPPVSAHLKRMQSQKQPLAALTRVSNGQQLSKRFTLSKASSALIVSLGEGDHTAFSDFGWLTSEKDGSVIWEMDVQQARYAGGTLRNKIQMTIMHLPAGTYHLHYLSDETHGYEHWQGDAPDKPHLWGISLFPLVPSDVKRFKKALNLTYYKKFYNQNIPRIYEDRNGRLWCFLNGSETPLHFFDPEWQNFIPYTLNIDPKVESTINGVFETNDGEVWFTTPSNNYISGYESKRFFIKTITSSAKQKQNPINKTLYFQDRKDRIWVGTNRGLFRYDAGADAFWPVAFSDSTVPVIIQSITEDDRGNLWLSTSSKLIKYNPGTNDEKIYDQSDGLPEISYSTRCCTRLQSGHLAFGGNPGFILFHPDSIQDNMKEPAVAITNLRIFNKSVHPGNDSPIQKTISESQEIELNYDQDVFTLEFAALDFTHPENNRYAYRMQGVDPDWVYVDAGRRFATYTKLKAGSYLFQVKGSNNDGLWNEQGSTLRIIIKPPFWQTAWFLLLMGILLLALLIYVIRYITTRKLKIRLRDLEYQNRLNKERERISRDMHDEVGSSLTRIAIQSELAGQNVQNNDMIKNQIRDIAGASREVVDNIGEIIWAINPGNDSLENLVSYLRQYVSRYLEITPVSALFDLPEELPKISLSAEMRRNIFLIVKEAMANIVKHAGAGQVRFQIQLNKKAMHLTISDDGKGFAPEEKRQFGNGLNNMQKRVQTLGGHWQLDTSSGKGTTIHMEINLPGGGHS
jgi:two-component sensor histidine kinase/streptogramin lyase